MLRENHLSLQHAGMHLLHLGFLKDVVASCLVEMLESGLSAQFDYVRTYLHTCNDNINVQITDITHTHIYIYIYIYIYGYIYIW